MKQSQFLLSHEFSIKKEFGGALLKRSHAKKPRPISTKNAMHLTLRSSKAKGKQSFLASRARRVLIETKIREVAGKFGVSIYKIAIVGNHIHMLLRATSRRGFISFLRAITGIIARIVLGAERGRAQLARGSAKLAVRRAKLSGGHTQLAKGQTHPTRGRTRQEKERFWDQRPWTRVIAWMKDFANVKKYVEQNFKEAMGFVPYQPRKKYSSTA